MDRLLLQVPLLGKLQRDVAAARFARTLGTLAASGLPILDALRITRGTMGNAALSQAIEATETEVTAGRPIAAPLESSGFFPALLIQVIGLGERTGRLDGMLLHAADAFDRQVGITIKVVTKALPPILLVFMSAIGGFVLAAVLLPMLSLGQSIQ
jgi:type II secretory pathway component PulF